jgi:Flp pilus assembly CpaE family ATPase
MAQKTTLNVLLLDMNSGKLESRTIFDIGGPEARDLGDLPENMERLDTCLLKKLVINMENSLNIILPSLKMDNSSILKTENLKAFIEILRDHFDIICIDMPAHILGYIALEQIDISDRFVFICLPDLFSAGNIRILMDHVRDYSYCYDFLLVINNYNIKPAISPAGLSKIIKYPIASFMPYDRDLGEIFHTRGPGHMLNHDLRLTRNISGLAERILRGILT